MMLLLLLLLLDRLLLMEALLNVADHFLVGLFENMAGSKNSSCSDVFICFFGIVLADDVVAGRSFDATVGMVSCLRA